MPETTDTTTTQPTTTVDAAAPVSHRSMTRSPSIAALAVALAKAQAAFTTIEKDKTANAGTYTYKFAGLASCLASVRPALAANGLAILQPVQISSGSVCATTMLVHGASGEWVSADYAQPCRGDDAKMIGGAVTYARRYGLLGLLAIAPDDEDEGEADGAESPSTRGQARGFSAPTNDLAAAARARSGDGATASSPPQGEPYDPAKDHDWHKFLGGCKGAPLGITPGEFLTRWATKMDGAKVKADLGFAAAWIAAGTGLKSPVVRDVVAEMKEAYNLATKRIGGAS